MFIVCTCRKRILIVSEKVYLSIVTDLSFYGKMTNKSKIDNEIRGCYN